MGELTFCARRTWPRPRTPAPHPAVGAVIRLRVIKFIRFRALRVTRLHQATRCHQFKSAYEPYTYTRPASCSSRGSSNSEPRGDDGVWSLRLFAFGGGARRRRWVVCMASSTYTHPASCVRCCHQAASHHITSGYEPYKSPSYIRSRGMIRLHQVMSRTWPHPRLPAPHPAVPQNCCLESESRGRRNVTRVSLHRVGSLKRIKGGGSKLEQPLPPAHVNRQHSVVGLVGEGGRG